MSRIRHAKSYFLSVKQGLCCCLAACLMSLGGCWQKPDSTRYITDDQGRALILHGINSSSSAKNPASDHMPWVTEADVEQETVDWGFNAVRLLIFWDGVEPEKGVFDDAYLDQVAERVNWYASRGAHVILDMHQDVYGYGVGGNGAPAWATELSLTGPFAMDFPGLPWWVDYIDPTVSAAFINFWRHTQYAYLQDHYLMAWQRVAQRFKHNPGVIGYDLMNEPYPGDLLKAVSFSFEKQWLKPFYDRLIPAIRSVDEDKWLFFEPQSLGVNFGFASTLPTLEDSRPGESRLAYAPHSYPMTLHEGITYNLTDRLNMREWNRNRTAELNRQQVPLVVGEFGGSDNTPGFAKYLDDTLTMFDTMGAGWLYWSNDKGSWGLLDENGNDNPKVDILVRPYARAIAGTPVLFGFDQATKAFTLQFREKAGVSGTTEIFIPRRQYPNGWNITSSDADGRWHYDWDETRQILFLSADSDSPVHTIRITAK